MKNQHVRLLAGLLLAILLVSAALIAMLFRVYPSPNLYEIEIAKAILQFGVVSVIGTGLSILVFKYQNSQQQFDKDCEHRRAQEDQAADRAREQAEEKLERKRKQMEYREDLLKSTLAKMMSSYNAVKTARRLL